MKKNYIFTVLLTLCVSFLSFGQDLVITGAIDGPLPGGFPKGIELYAINSISDLSIYGLESTTNGAAAKGAEFTFPADAIAAGTFIYVAHTGSLEGFQQYLGVTPQYENGVANINGDDAVILYKNDAIEDLLGRVEEDGTGKDWDHLDGWAYRKSGKGPTTTFTPSEWSFSGANALDGCDKSDDSGTNAACSSVFPVGTYSTVASTTPALTINSPKSGAISNTSSVDVSITVDNFTFSGDNGSGGSDNSGDGYIKAILDVQGGTTSVSNFFSTTVPAIEVAAGNTYILTLELVDNSGASLATKTSQSVTFTIEFPCAINLESFSASCDANTTGIDTYSISIPFTGGNTSTYNLTTSSGIIGGDNPSTSESGTIVISEVEEGTNVVFNIKGDSSNSSCDIRRNISSPTCLPEPTCPAEGTIIITEIMQNPNAVSDSLGEYFEVYNTTDAPIDLLGWTISTASSGDPVVTTIDVSLVVPAKGYIVLAENSDATTNGGVTVNYQYNSSLFLGNGKSTVKIECSASVFDTVTYDGGSEFPDPTGKSMELATNKYSATDNDTGANWAEATAEIVTGGDLGTPGAVNSFVLNVDRNSILGFTAYPNPVTNGKLIISSNSVVSKEISIYNLLGKKMFATQFSGVKSTINVSTLNSGLYILKVKEGHKLSTKKLCIE